MLHFVKIKNLTIKSLGRGRFGHVFLVREKKTKFKIMFALKRLSKHYVGKHDLYENFRREAKINLQLKHPNVIQMFGYFYDEKHVYFVMEYVLNGSLYDKIQKEGRLSERTAATVIKLKKISSYKIK
jgi:serine/threonine protein kinase